MENTPEAAAPAPTTGETVATPTNTNTEPAQTPAVDMHGFTPEDLAGMRTFIDNNGGWDKIKSRISNPEKPTEKAVEPQMAEEKKEEPTSHTQAQPVEQAKKMGLTNDEIAAQYYFEKLSREEKYAPISKEIANGDVLTEMSKLGIQFKYPDGSWNKDRIGDYLDLRAKTVPAKPTSTEPNASTAPTVDYVNVGEKIENIDQAYKVIMQHGHPKAQMAEEFIKNYLNPDSSKK